MIPTCKAGVEGGDWGGGGGDSWAHSKPPHAKRVNIIITLVVRRAQWRKEATRIGSGGVVRDDSRPHITASRTTILSSIIRFLCAKAVVSQKSGRIGCLNSETFAPSLSNCVVLNHLECC